ncbi:hypothetical protein GA0061078_0007 [Bifidobacterium bohemicum]|uniref:Putative replication protein n=2 Tax=Bifidobacterium bohemicum TaxID=638617 RepID=A0A086ZDZ4_9BIFI|nr:putative replication protein [Bifidobacterium bohemicum DSM 22767]SCC17538.1 hypothetical protein GA0061078_0007 [Bifidobacterium bohemicum]
MVVIKIWNSKVFSDIELLRLRSILAIKSSLSALATYQRSDLGHYVASAEDGLEVKMSIITMRYCGGSASLSNGNSGNNGGAHGVRRMNKGWTKQAARSLEKFLQSVNPCDVGGRPFALSLTIKAELDENGIAMNIPDSDMFHRWINQLFKGCARNPQGQREDVLLAYVWLLEWQGNGEPHLHGVAWWPEDIPVQDVRRRMVDRWRKVLNADDYDMGGSGYAIKLMRDTDWFLYLSKHGSMGVNSYQRSYETMPESWTRRPGAMWGHSQHFPLEAVYKFDLDHHEDSDVNADSRCSEGKGFYVYRRLVCAWELSKLRSEKPDSGIVAMRQWKRNMGFWKHRRKHGLDRRRTAEEQWLDQPVEPSDFTGQKNLDPWGESSQAFNLSGSRRDILGVPRLGTHLGSQRRGISGWMSSEAQRQILQYIADNQEQIGCRVAQTVKDTNQQSILIGVPTVEKVTR